MAEPTDLFHAIMDGDLAAVRSILTAEPELAGRRNDAGISPVMLALYHRQPDIAAAVVDAGPALDFLELTALGRAADVEALLEAGSGAVSAVSPDGFTALHYAAFFGHPDLVALLLARGADPGVVSDNPMQVQPLHSAAARRSLESVRHLLEGGAPVNGTQQQGWTALHSAAQQGDVDLVMALLEHGADPTITSDDGKTAADLADAAGQTAAAELLRVAPEPADAGGAGSAERPSAGETSGPARPSPRGPVSEGRPWHAFYDEGVPRCIEYQDLTIPSMLARSAVQFGNRPALIFQNGTLTYSQFKEEVDRLATALAGLGVEQGSRVAIQLPNLPQTVIAYFATLRLGAIAVMTNPLYVERELEHQWNDAGATVAIVMDFLYKARIEPIRGRLRVKHFIVASIPEYLRFPLSVLAPLKLKRASPPMIAKVEPGRTVHLFRRLIAGTAPAPPTVAIDMDDIAMLQYTGGTTGVSKGAILTHRNVSVNVQQCRAWNTGGEEGRDVCICCLPLFHIYGLTVAMLTTIHAGGALVMIPNPRDIGSIVKGIVKHEATMCPAVPAMYNGINQYPGIDKIDISSVKVCNSGSAPLPVEVLQRFEALTGGKIAEGYGLTETSPVTHSNPFHGRRKAGSIGVPFPDTDARIVDLEDGVTDVPVGEAGELLLKGPQVFPGYWNRDDETEKVFRGGWFCTGDIARMDEEGFHYIVGRKKDMILASGYNVYPDEIDRVLMAHPDILEAATIGVPDEKRGETVKSFIVLHEGKSLSAEAIIAYCKENLAAYKVPKAIEFRDSLPKSTVLKILRRQLRDEELAKG